MYHEVKIIKQLEMTPTVSTLLLITFLDSLSIGLLVPVLSPHIMKHGGRHIHLGILAAGTFCFQTISYIFIASVQQVYGKKSALLVTLSSSFISYAIMVCSPSYWAILLSRLLFAFTNRAEVVCKAIALESEAVGGIFDATDIAGIVIGPILGGLLYYWTQSTLYHCVIALYISVVNIVLLRCLTVEIKPQERFNYLENHIIRTVEKFKELTQIQYKTHWHFILLKFFYILCHTIFFTKFSFLINSHFNLNIIIIGFTISYQNILVFISNFFCSLIKAKMLSRFPKIYCFECSLFIFSMSLLLLFYAPAFDWYLLFLIPMVFSYTMVNSLWHEVLNEEINVKSNGIKTVVGMFIPIIFGFMCDQWNDKAFRIFAFLPIILCIYMIRRRIVDVENKKQD